MKAGIVGFPKVGKTTLFNILTRGHAETSRFSQGKKAINVGVSEVPDPRLEKLHDMIQPKKKTLATTEFVDLVGVNRGEIKNTEYLANLRTVDCLIHVVRAFEDAEMGIGASDIHPHDDIQEFNLELILADMDVIQNRLEKLRLLVKKVKSKENEEELMILERCIKQLENEKPIRELDFEPIEKRRLRSFAFLSEKPLLHIINLSEDRLSEREKYLSESLNKNQEITYVCGTLEQQIGELSPDERQEFLDQYHFEESGRDRVIRTTFKLLDLILFFTAGPEEVRSWPLLRGTPAQKAAGTVHSDMERGFIRAEVVSYEDFLKTGSFAEAKKHGVFRLEGKEYIVQDGDIITFRFNV
ncbi:redox-regulated ATPase YchF [bacterium]|nr:redox-regulated ATPase YchF [bacterium]MCI0612792.1 redox-regulated ATPase YchF [bacterium]